MTEFIAHRGVHDSYTENTLDAFARALELGFDAVELDVHATADGICVVHHDASVATEKIVLPIRRTYYDTLLAAAPFIPRLDAVLELVRGRAHAYVELKGLNIETAVARTLEGFREGFRDGVSVHSFDHRAVRRIRSLMPGLETGVLELGSLVDSAHALRSAGATDLWQWHEFVDAELVQNVTSAGGRVIIWTSNAPSDWHGFERIGVAGICTDLPLNRSERILCSAASTPL